jgi:hypothetical protein
MIKATTPNTNILSTSIDNNIKAISKKYKKPKKILLKFKKSNPAIFYPEEKEESMIDLNMIQTPLIMLLGDCVIHRKY